MQKIKKLPQELIFLIVFIVFAVSYYSYDRHKTKKILSETNKEYPLILKDEQINGKIISLPKLNPMRFRENSHKSLVVIEGGIKKRITVGYEKRTQSSFFELIEIGDILEKDSGNWELRLIKNNQDTFYFVLKDDLGYHHKD